MAFQGHLVEQNKMMNLAFVAAGVRYRDPDIGKYDPIGRRRECLSSRRDQPLRARGHRSRTPGGLGERRGAQLRACHLAKSCHP